MDGIITIGITTIGTMVGITTIVIMVGIIID